MMRKSSSLWRIFPYLVRLGSSIFFIPSFNFSIVHIPYKYFRQCRIIMVCGLRSKIFWTVWRNKIQARRAPRIVRCCLYFVFGKSKCCCCDLAIACRYSFLFYSGLAWLLIEQNQKGSKSSSLKLPLSGGDRRIWTAASEFCRLVPYHLAMSPFHNSKYYII